MPRRAFPDQVYVAGFHDGTAVKVGASSDPARRAAALQSATGRPVALFWSKRVRPAEFVEANALAVLEPNRIKGEWFAVSPEAAAAVVEAAIRRCVDPATGWFREGLDVQPHLGLRWRRLILTPFRTGILARLRDAGPARASDLAAEFATSSKGAVPMALRSPGAASAWARTAMHPMLWRGLVIHDERVDAYAITGKGLARLRRGPDSGGGHPPP